MSPRRDDGYAIVAAVAALAVFSAIALAVLAADHGDIEDMRAQFAQARLGAAADAGLVQAIAGLANDEPARRWPIDGRPQTTVFDGVQLVISVEDERGKVPMDGLSEEQARRLFSSAGARGEQLDVLVDSYEDWLDDDDEVRPHGAEADYYALRGLHPRNGPPLTVDELAQLRGMTPEILNRIRPVLTSHFGLSGGFSPQTASPQAIAVQSGGEGDSVDAIIRRRAADGDRPVVDIAAEKAMIGRAVTVVVRALDGQGGGLERRTVVELSGKTPPGYYIREMD